RLRNGPQGLVATSGLNVAYTRSGAVARHTIATIDTKSPDHATARATRRMPVRASVSRDAQNIAMVAIATRAARTVAVPLRLKGRFCVPDTSSRSVASSVEAWGESAFRQSAGKGTACATT